MLERDGANRLELAAEGQELLQVVNLSVHQLASEAETLPPSVVNNGRYQDVVRALQSVTATLESFAFAAKDAPIKPDGRVQPQA